MSKSFVVFLSLLMSFTFSLYAQTGTVVFQVSNVQTDKGGEISAGIFHKPNFPKVGKQYRSIEKTVDSNYMEVSILNVPVGTYGAVVFQDTNNNKKLETNFVGFPKEPIGFANGAKIRFGAPSFEDASISVTEGESIIVKIKLK